MITFISEPPHSLIVGGRPYEINTDFRLMVEFENKVNGADISDKRTFSRILSETITELFIEKPDVAMYASETVEQLMWYFRCGKEPEKGGNSTKRSRRCYDFGEDCEYIYAAFMQQYGIDLMTARMHWWTFRGLFVGLTDETELVKIMQYRSIDLSKIKNKSEKARLKKLQEKFALKDRKVQQFASLADRDKAYRERIKQRYEEVKRLAAEQEGR